MEFWTTTSDQPQPVIHRPGTRVGSDVDEPVTAGWAVQWGDTGADMFVIEGGPDPRSLRDYFQALADRFRALAVAGDLGGPVDVQTFTEDDRGNWHAVPAVTGHILAAVAAGDGGDYFAAPDYEPAAV